MDMSTPKAKKFLMPRLDQDNRNKSGFYKPKYKEPLSKVYGVSLFKSDEEKLKAIALERGIPPAELIREIVREFLQGQRNDEKFESVGEASLGVLPQKRGTDQTDSERS